MSSSKVNLRHKHGFSIHLDKVRLDHTQSMQVLRTQVNSVLMHFGVALVKRKCLWRKWHDTLRLDREQILSVHRHASLIGTFNSVRGTVTSAPLLIWLLLHRQKLEGWDNPVHLIPCAVQEI